MCARSDIYMFVEPHQDEMHRDFCGEGATDWWASTHTKVTNFPVPAQDTPFARSPPTHKTCNTHSSFSYIWTDDAARAYQTLWESGAQTGFGAFWAAVAKEFAGAKNVIGGEIWNEPFPGDVFGNAVQVTRACNNMCVGCGVWGMGACTIMCVWGGGGVCVCARGACWCVGTHSVGTLL